MNAPASAIAPPASHAPRISAGVCTSPATTYGLMKIPEPTMPPITSIVASNNPKRAARARRGSASGCKETAGASRDGVSSGKKQRAHEVRRLADYTSRHTTVSLVAKTTTAKTATSIRQPHHNQALLKRHLPANNLARSLVHTATGKVTSAA